MEGGKFKQEEKDGSIILYINPELYPLDVIYSAAYVFLDRAYVRFDGDPKKEVLVKLKPKQQLDLENLGGEFGNELVNYAFYKIQGEKTKKIRNMIIERALITNDQELLIDGDYIDDPEGIAVPWEEKYERDKDKTE